MTLYLVRMIECEASHVDSVWSSEEKANERKSFLKNTYFKNDTNGIAIEKHELDQVVDGGKLIYHATLWKSDGRIRVERSYEPLADYQPYYTIDKVNDSQHQRTVLFLASSDEEAQVIANEKLIEK